MSTPLRTDFDQISRFERSGLDVDPTHSAVEAVFNEYSTLGLNMCLALSALATTRERLRDVEIQMERVKGRPALGKKLRRYQAVQADAMAHNSLACAQLGDDLVALSPRVNAAWQRVSEEHRRLPRPTPEQMQKASEDMRDANATLLRDKFKLSDTDIEKLCRSPQDFLAGLKEPPPIPAVLLDDEWKKATEQMAAHHRKVAETYSQLKERLEQAAAGGARPAAP